MLRQYLSIILLVMLIPATAFAQTPEQIASAREHFSRGQLAFSQERWLDCATHFEESFQAIFAPELLYNIGLCYERAADLADAEDPLSYRERALAAYTRYLRELPEASDATAVRIRVADLRTLLERARAAVVEEPVDEPEAVVEEVTPPPIVDEPEEDDLVVPDIVVVASSNRGFGFGWTLTSGAFTVVSFVTALGLSMAAQDQFNSLVTTCGQTTMGCSMEDVSSVVSLATGANALYGVSGVLLAATGVAFGLEFHLWSTTSETHASLSYSASF